MSQSGLRIARVFGIDIIVDWSWTLIAGLMTLSVTSAFAHWHPGWHLMGAFALGLAAMALFFASLIAHELAHAVVAKSLGLSVSSIRLFLFGGVSNIDREPPSAAGELGMAIVGPVLSIGIGLTLLGIATLVVPFGSVSAESLARLGPITTLLVWLGAVNVGVGIFNLTPAFPIDGGRVLRALVWAITRDLERATRIVTRISQVIGGAFIVIGAASFLGVHLVPFARGSFDGLWMALIGWFITSAATRSRMASRVHAALEGITVGRMMREARRTLRETASVHAFVDILIASGDRVCGVVSPTGTLTGIVSVTDLQKVDRKEWADTPISTIMTRIDHLVCASPTDPIESAMTKLSEHHVEQLPVVDDGYFVGMLERQQLSRWLSVWLAAAPDAA